MPDSTHRLVHAADPRTRVAYVDIDPMSTALARELQAAVVTRYTAALAPGSFLVLSHITSDGLPDRIVDRGIEVSQKATQNVFPRTRADVTRFFDGLQVVSPWPGAEPVLAAPGRWRGTDGSAEDGDRARGFCAVARRP